MPEKIRKFIACSFCELEINTIHITDGIYESYDGTRFITYEYVYESNNHSNKEKYPVCFDCNDYWKAMHSLPLSHKDFRESEYAQEIIQENEDELADFKR